VAFVFISGLWEPSDIWDNVIGALTLPVPKVVVSLPEHSGTSASSYTLNDYVNAVSTVVQSQSPVPVVLVSHSFSSVVAALVAQQNPTLVRSLVFVSSPVPQNGDSIWSLIQSSALKSHVVSNSGGYSLDPTGVSLFLGNCVQGGTVYDAVKSMLASFEEPAAPMQTPAVLSSNYNEIPKIVITGTGDQVVTSKSVPSTVRLITIPGGHSSPLCRPRELARQIQSIAMLYGLTPTAGSHSFSGKTRQGRSRD